MNRFRFVLTLGVVAFLTGNAVAAEKYNIDKVHSSVGFAVRHNMVSMVKGSFTDYMGEIMLDPSDITKSSVTVTIKTASINTANKGRDNHLRSPDFFDAPTYPEITFKSTRIEKKNTGWVAHGSFTMHGVTKEIALPFTLTGPIMDGRGKLIGIESSTTINRQDYGVKWSRILDAGGVAVAMR